MVGITDGEGWCGMNEDAFSLVPNYNSLNWHDEEEEDEEDEEEDQ